MTYFVVVRLTSVRPVFVQEDTKIPFLPITPNPFSVTHSIDIPFSPHPRNHNIITHTTCFIKRHVCYRRTIRSKTTVCEVLSLSHY